MPWFKVLTSSWQHEKILALPTDSARWSWLILLSLAKEKDGVFGSEEQLRTLMGRRFKWVACFREQGLMEDLRVHNWDVYQQNPDRSAERMRRLRARRTLPSDGPGDASPVRHVTDGDREGEGDRERESEKDAPLSLPTVGSDDERECWAYLRDRGLRDSQRIGAIIAEARAIALERTGGRLRSLDHFALRQPGENRVHLLEEVLRRSEERRYAEHKQAVQSDTRSLAEILATAQKVPAASAA
jgi:hypothetical protein